MKKESKQSPKTKPKKTSSKDKSITIRVPIDAYKSLRQLAADNEMTVNALFDFYVQQIVNQEADNVPILSDPSNSLVDSGKQEALTQERISSVKNFGVKYEKFDISSTSFVRVYFNNFVLAIVVCLGVTSAAYLAQPLIASVFIPIFLSLIWGVVRIIAGSTTRKDGSRLLISGIGWLIGTLSVSILAFLLFAIIQAWRDPPIISLFVLLFGIVFVGLLVNVPIEINNAFIKKRTVKINKHVVEWGDEICQAILDREIQPDMTKEMVLLAWGKPTVIENQEATKNTFTEKWIYKSTPKASKTMYIWFVNGLVNKINDFGA